MALEELKAYKSAARYGKDANIVSIPAALYAGTGAADNIYRKIKKSKKDDNSKK